MALALPLHHGGPGIRPAPSVAVVETPRLRLRPPDAGDVHELWEMHQDPEVNRYLASTERDLPVAWRCLAMMVGHWQLRGYGPWLIVMKRDGRIVGRTGLWKADGGPGLELGWMVRRSDWGKGIATEAASAAVAWAWQHLPDDHIVSEIHAANLRSVRVAEKLGQRLEAREFVRGAEVCTYGSQRPAMRLVVSPGAAAPRPERRASALRPVGGHTVSLRP